MGRLNNNIDINETLYVGVFNATLKKATENSVILKDIFTRQEFEIYFNIVNDTFQMTKSGKKVWINETGDVGYGEEEDLFDTFINSYAYDQWDDAIKKFNKRFIGTKKYWQAKKGEVHIVNFLKAYSGVNFEKLKNNNYNLKKLLLSDTGHDPTICGMMYVSEDLEQKILEKYIPGMYAALIKNTKGDFSTLTKVPYPIKDFVTYFESGMQPLGYYSWKHLHEWTGEGINSSDKSKTMY